MVSCMFLDRLSAEVFVHTVVVLDIYLYVPNKYKFEILMSLRKTSNQHLIAKVRATVDATAHHE